jgi:hypothetical protein
MFLKRSFTLNVLNLGWKFVAEKTGIETQDYWYVKYKHMKIDNFRAKENKDGVQLQYILNKKSSQSNIDVTVFCSR